MPPKVVSTHSAGEQKKYVFQYFTTDTKTSRVSEVSQFVENVKIHSYSVIILNYIWLSLLNRIEHHVNL